MDRRPPSVRSFAPYEFFSYAVSCVDEKAINYSNFYSSEKNELSISIGGKLVSNNSQLCLESHELAEVYLNKKINQWKKQWGEDIEIEIIKWTSNDRKGFFTVLDHSDLIKTRLRINE